MKSEDQKLFFAGAVKHDTLAQALWNVATDQDSLKGNHEEYFKEAANRAFSAITADMMHSSAPFGHKCADCTMDKEACPTCYGVWWKKRHPNVTIIGG